jgi:predicted AAA+ superfamily ATPase
MNENISQHEIKYIARRLATKLRKGVEQFPVTVLTGARQVGKSTLLQHEFPDFTYLTLDDYALREQARLDPQSLWAGTDRLIIDEAQKLPEIFDAIKLAVDQAGTKRKFILSGSANLLLMRRVTESLAGRAYYLELLPLTWGEEHGHAVAGNFASLWQTEHRIPETSVGPIPALPFLLRGFMPKLAAFSGHDEVLNWLEGYVRTYLERDLRELSQVDSLVDFRKVMQCLAPRTGSILNQADVAKDSGISHSTTHRYIKLLEVSNIIERVPAYSVNRGRRLVKSPKLFFVDPALAVFLSGYYDAAGLSASRELGHYFETMVYLHLRALCETMTPKAGLYYWRTVAGREVDFVIEHGRRLLAFEVRHTANPTAFDIKNLLAFLDEYPETVRGVVVHAGDQIKWLHSKVVAVPWWWLDAS